MVEIQHPSTLWVALQNRSKIAKVARTRSAFNHVVNEGRLPLNVNIHNPNSFISMHKLLPISTVPPPIQQALQWKNPTTVNNYVGQHLEQMRGVQSLSKQPLLRARNALNTWELL